MTDTMAKMIQKPSAPNKRRKFAWLVTGGIAVGLLVLGTLFFYFPASWLQGMWQPQLEGIRLYEVSGSIWHGYAERITDNQDNVLGRLQWRLSKRILFGDIRFSWQLTGPQIKMHGAAQRSSPTLWILHDVDADVNMDWLKHWIPSRSQPGGYVHIHIKNAQLQDGWPFSLQAWGTWQNASLLRTNATLALGTLSFQAKAAHALLQVLMNDDGTGPLQVHGEAVVSLLGWRLSAKLRARNNQPLLKEWLQGLGPMNAQGIVKVDRRAGLAAMLPLPSYSENL